MLKHVNESNFENEVMKNSKPVLVDFYAEWCGPCKMLAPVLDEISKSSNEYDIAKINVDESEELAYSYGIRAVPTLMVFNDGKLQEVLNVYPSLENIKEVMKKYMK